MKLPLRCNCGKVAGLVDSGGVTIRGTCYCRDCQAYARFLGRPERILDAKGGTQIVGTLHGRLQFTSGHNHIGCMTLTPYGPYRWYADCCLTPIGNTPRTAKAPYISLLRCVVDAEDAQLDAAFGPARFTIGTDGATAPVRRTPIALGLAVPKIAWNMLLGRFFTPAHDSPFFDPIGGGPIRAPLALGAEQRRVLRGEAHHH